VSQSTRILSTFTRRARWRQPAHRTTTSSVVMGVIPAGAAFAAAYGRIFKTV